MKSSAKEMYTAQRGGPTAGDENMRLLRCAKTRPFLLVGLILLSIILSPIDSFAQG